MLMHRADPTLRRLIDEAARATAALRAYVEGAPADPEDDFLTLKEAAFAFGKSEDTIRRWAVDEGMGAQPGGRNTPWLISQAAIVAAKGIAVRQNTQRNTQPCPTDRARTGGR